MTYSPEIEHSMRLFYDSLLEKDRRRFAAIVAAKLGHGGTESISTVLGCNPKTTRQGRRDMDRLPDGLDDGVRKKRAGRRDVSTPSHFLEENFLRVLRDRTAGDVPVVKQLLKKHGYVTRKAQKS